MEINTFVEGCFYVFGPAFQNPVFHPKPCNGSVVVKASGDKSVCVLDEPCALLCVHSPMRVIGKVETLVWDCAVEALLQTLDTLVVQKEILLSSEHSRDVPESLRVTLRGVTLGFY